MHLPAWLLLRGVAPRALANRFFDLDGSFLLIVLGVVLKSLYFNLSIGLVYGERYGQLFNFLLLSLAVTPLLFWMARGKWNGLLLAGSFSLLLEADFLYFRFFHALPSLEALPQVSGVAAIAASLLPLLHVQDLLLFVDLPFLAFWRRVPRFRPNKLVWCSWSLVAMFSLFLLSGRIGWTSLHSALLGQTYHQAYLLDFGIVHYHFQDALHTARHALLRKPPLSVHALQELERWFASRPEPAHPGAAPYRGKNLILIQVESLQGFVIGRSVNGQPITPFLNDLASRSLYFSNFYPQIGPGHTSDAEFLTQTSRFGLAHGVSFHELKHHHFQALPSLLAARGYQTLSMHGNFGAYYDRANFHRVLGFENAYFQEQLDARDRIGMGISDRSFLSQAFQVAERAKSPYYLFLITVTSHHPYSWPLPSRHPLRVEGVRQPLIADYLQAIHYTDEALGEFYAQLKASGHLKDTVLVLYGDHGAIPWQDRQQLAGYLSEDVGPREWLRAQRVPLLVHGPDQRSLVITKPGGQLDVAPTVSSLLGVGMPRLSLGQDLLSSASSLVVQRDGSWIAADALEVAGFDRMDSTASLVRTQEALTLLRVSDALNEYDLGAKLLSTRRPAGAPL